VLTKPALGQLADIATLGVRTGAEVVNFLGFNPFNDQQTGKRSAMNVPRYAELAGPLDEALDILAAAGVEANVRYLPFCAVAKRHRKSVYDFSQIPYDLHENDFASWSWTDLPAQRMRDASLTPPIKLGPRLRLGALRAPLRRLAMELPQAAGNRYICAGEHLWVQDMAKVLAAEFNPRGYRVPTGHLPYWLMWVFARFDKAVRLALTFVGRKELVSSAKAQRELGWTMRPVRESIVDTARTMIEHRIVPAR